MSDRTELQWVDGTPEKDPRGGTAKYAEHLPALKENPGRWAIVATYKWHGSGIYNAAKRLRAQGFEAIGKSEGGVSNLYAMWPGDAEGAPEPTPIRYPCDFCDEEMDTPGGLKHHIRRRHPNEAA